MAIAMIYMIMFRDIVLLLLLLLIIHKIVFFFPQVKSVFLNRLGLDSIMFVVMFLLDFGIFDG